MKASLVRLLACVVVPFLAACGPEPSGPVAAGPVTYTCCAASEVDRLYRPGQTVTLHWSVEAPDEPGPATPPRVELTALLTGPFATVDELKIATTDTRTVPGLVTFAAAPVRPSGAPGERPVSTIAIGSDARPGYYHLATSVIGDGGTAGGASVVRLVPGT
ncbi:hypothetical protein Q2K19_01280 [Micromonospora soli]|uniref:hypothetical protein n=1 Tax=Micromonospora sp. NBRC 110009 TaxID=3061627 RepID=UPI002673DCC2|nr:hypothetical protein [Micromonospora sp. NBRC 110009]WKT99178.1 hypothetical protein Q2K19_01280 [Micromonospora sp. NBRC 110009]